MVCSVVIWQNIFFFSTAQIATILHDFELQKKLYLVFNAFNKDMLIFLATLFLFSELNTSLIFNQFY